MKKLYIKLVELLSTIPEIKYIDLNYGQLQEEKPSVIFPAVLISMDVSTSDNVQDKCQIVTGNFDLTICNKMMSETNNLAPELVREKALEYLEIGEKIYKKLQGFQNEEFECFSRKSAKDQQTRKGLKTTVQRWETSWQEVTN